MQSTQRHKVLFEQKECFWQTDVPIIIEETVLIGDKQTGKLYVRNSFRSMSEKIISAVMVAVACKDVWGNKLENNETFQYLDLKVGKNSLFGQNEPIEIKNNNTRSVFSSIQKVLFEDGSIIECSQDGIRFPTPLPLSAQLGNQELASEYARESVATAKYVPTNLGEYWRCTCGTINLKETPSCELCGSDFSALTELLNTDALSSNLQIYKKEQAEKAEAERIAEQERIKEAALRAKQEQESLQRKLRIAEEEKAAVIRSKKRKKTALISIITIIVVAIAYFTYIGPEIVQPKITYNQACSLLSNGQYEEAITKFQEIPGYKNSSEMIDEAKYCQAKALLDKKQYASAISKFEKITYYKDSKDQVLECKYSYVSAHKNNNDATTFDYLKDLKNKGYKDSYTIYSDLYDWKIEMNCCNTKSDDWTTKSTSISKYCKYMHINFQLSGGTPNEKINLTHTVIFPDGDSNVSDWDWENKYDGDNFGFEYASGLYTYPEYGATGSMIIKIYNADTYTLMDTFTIKITN